ncbi:hypothetical protein NQ318_005492 [Aromia moschata]|uniref:Integrase zinc-binding domain-containing protein n=1 Tax=Aromia moschata TaxID=1265417 RepID=A0AAV8XQB1_9CUCU|nr:hypothetical protein NQ318_005492 [Aromia moschata]
MKSPETECQRYWREIHNGSTGGHLGVTKTLGKVRERFYWVNCTTDVKEWCKKCVVCASSNGPQRHPKAPMRQCNVGSPFERIAIDVAAPFAGSNDEQAEARVRHVSPPDGELSFEEFMSLHSNGQKARYGVTREEPRDLFQTPADFCLAHCVAADLRMSRGIALTFKKTFGQLEELRRQRPEVGRVLQITAAEQEKESPFSIW